VDQKALSRYSNSNARLDVVCLAFEDSRIGLISAKKTDIETFVSQVSRAAVILFKKQIFFKSFLLKVFPIELKKR